MKKLITVNIIELLHINNFLNDYKKIEVKDGKGIESMQEVINLSYDVCNIVIRLYYFFDKNFTCSWSCNGYISNITARELENFREHLNFLFDNDIYCEVE